MWGTLTVGGLQLRELDVLADATNANTGERAVRLDGIETTPAFVAATVEARQEDIMGLLGRTVPMVFQRKTTYNGFYVVTDTNTELEKWAEGPEQVRWSIAATFVGPDNQVDIESRLANVVRANDFALTGERWHAPAIGHYSYQVGSAVPSFVSRTSVDGAITVYRSIPAATNPRWGATPANYALGRARVLQGSLERTGVGVTLTPTGWEVNNGLVRVVPSGVTTTSLVVSAWTGGAWQAKSWDVRINGVVMQTAHVKAVSLLRNDFEMVVLRLVVQMPADSSRRILDLSLRRGSRFVEGYLQVASSTTLAVTPDVAETATDNSAAGWMRATSNDTAGNRFVIGSARTFTAEANGGIQKATTTLDFFIGVEAGGSAAVAGDQGLDLRNQYIGAMAEKVGVARR